MQLKKMPATHTFTANSPVHNLCVTFDQNQK